LELYGQADFATKQESLRWNDGNDGMVDDGMFFTMDFMGFSIISETSILYVIVMLYCYGNDGLLMGFSSFPSKHQFH
jgi:hypothetical protein